MVCVWFYLLAAFAVGKLDEFAVLEIKMIDHMWFYNHCGSLTTTKRSPNRDRRSSYRAIKEKIFPQLAQFWKFQESSLDHHFTMNFRKA